MSTDQAARNITAASQGSTRVAGSLRNQNPGAAPADSAGFQAMLLSLGDEAPAEGAAAATNGVDPQAIGLADPGQGDDEASARDPSVRAEDLLLQMAMLGLTAWNGPQDEPPRAGQAQGPVAAPMSLQEAARAEPLPTLAGSTESTPASAAAPGGRPGWSTLAAQRSARQTAPAGADAQASASALARVNENALTAVATALGGANPANLLLQAGAALATSMGADRLQTSLREGESADAALAVGLWSERDPLTHTDRVSGVAGSDASLRAGEAHTSAIEMAAPSLEAAASEGLLSPADVDSLAEQISLWVSQGVNEAELRLDGPDQEPVEVSIAVRGQETSVAFRTDQAFAREALERALGMLQDQLRSQGLSLAAFSVGDFGPGGRGEGRGPDSGPPGQRLTLRRDMGVVPDGAVAAARARGNSAQGVDVFV